MSRQDMTCAIFRLRALLLIISPALAEVGADGFHKKPWFTVSFKDVAGFIKSKKASSVTQHHNQKYDSMLRRREFSGLLMIKVSHRN